VQDFEIGAITVDRFQTRKHYPHTGSSETSLPDHLDHCNPFGRKISMSAYNDPLLPIDCQKLILYSVQRSLPSHSILSSSKSKAPTLIREINLHVLAHLDASDRNSLLIILNHLGVGNKFTPMVSPSHTVIFHVEADMLFALNGLVDCHGVLPAISGTEVSGSIVVKL
jgi:hypothetical protein